MQFLQLKSKIYWTVIEIYLQDDSGKKQGPFALNDPKLAELIHPNSQVFPTHEGRWMKAADVKELRRLLDAKDSTEFDATSHMDERQQIQSKDAEEPQESGIRDQIMSSGSAANESDPTAESPEVEPEPFVDSESVVELSSWGYFVRCLKLYATFSGRARRSEYWSWMLLSYLFLIPMLMLDGAVPGTTEEVGFFQGVYSLLTFIPGLAVLSRRLHDTGRSAWWYLIVFTGIGAIVLIFWLFENSKPGPNKWGPNPKGIN